MDLESPDVNEQDSLGVDLGGVDRARFASVEAPSIIRSRTAVVCACECGSVLSPLRPKYELDGPALKRRSRADREYASVSCRQRRYRASRR